MHLNYYCISDGFVEARPCDATADFLPPGAPPPPNAPPEEDWTPFSGWLEFELADFLYSRDQMPAQQIDTLLDIWGESLSRADARPLFRDHKELYKTIDTIQEGDIKWQCFSLQYTRTPEDEDEAAWMDATYDVWYRCPRETIHSILANPELADKMDYRPYREYTTQTNERHFQNFMGEDWAWDQAVGHHKCSLNTHGN